MDESKGKELGKHIKIWRAKIFLKQRYEGDGGGYEARVIDWDLMVKHVHAQLRNLNLIVKRQGGANEKEEKNKLCSQKKYLINFCLCHLLVYITLC